MKNRLFWLVFCLFVAAGTASAQKLNWVRVPTPDEAYFGVQYLDMNSIQRPSGGNVVFTSKMGHTVTQFEVECTASKFRTLKEIELPWSMNGMSFPAAKSDKTFPTAWGTFVDDGSVISSLSKKACPSARPAVKRAVVKKKATK